MTLQDFATYSPQLLVRNMELFRTSPLSSRQRLCWLTHEVRPVLSSWLCLKTW